MRVVEWVRLKSHAVVAAGYDAATRQLELEFSSGHAYRYEGVAQPVFEWLLRTKNKGGFVRRMIQGRYPESALRSAAQVRGAGECASPEESSLEEVLRASLEQLTRPPV
jgi:hypothetical protein